MFYLLIQFYTNYYIYVCRCNTKCSIFLYPKLSKYSIIACNSIFNRMQVNWILQSYCIVQMPYLSSTSITRNKSILYNKKDIDGIFRKMYNLCYQYCIESKNSWN